MEYCVAIKKNDPALHVLLWNYPDLLQEKKYKTVHIICLLV